MNTEIYKTGAGVPLTLLQTQKFKTEFFSISSVYPIDREDAPLTSLLLSVLRRGTEKFPSLQALNKRLDSLYGTELSIRNFYRGDYQVIGFSLDFLGKRYLPDGRAPLLEALEVVAEILFHPLLDENGLLLSSYVEDEKRYQQDVIRSLKNNPAGYALDRCQSLFYEGRPCSFPVYGTTGEIAAVTPKRLTAHWKKILSRFRPECFFVGSLEKEEIDDALTAVFADAFQTPLPFASRRFFAGKGNERTLDEDFPAGQSHLVVGLSTGTILGDADYYAVKVYNELLLGSSPVSKLFLGLREQKSLCYSCLSVYNSYTGAIFIRCGLSSDCRKEAEEEIRHQMQELANGRFSEAELEAAKSAYLTAFHAIEDSPEALESYYFGRGLLGLDIPLAKSCQAVLVLKKEDLIRVAKRVAWDTEFFLKGKEEEKGKNDENDED